MMFYLYAEKVWACLTAKNYELDHTISQYPLFQKSQNGIYNVDKAGSAYRYNWKFLLGNTLRKLLRVKSVISVNLYYITVLWAHF